MRNFSVVGLILLVAGCGVSSGLSEEPQTNIAPDGDSPAGADGTDVGMDPGATGAPGSGDGDGDGSGSAADQRPCGDGGDCDPENLGGETCMSLGASGGQLACDPVTCTFDMSMRTGMDDQGSGGTGGGFPGGGAFPGGDTGGGQSMFGGGDGDGDMPMFGGDSGGGFPGGGFPGGDGDGDGDGDSGDGDGDSGDGDAGDGDAGDGDA